MKYEKMILQNFQFGMKYNALFVTVYRDFLDCLHTRRLSTNIVNFPR